MVPINLSQEAMKLLQILARYGAMSPGKLAAETWILPGETQTLLSRLSSAGFVLVRDDTNSPDGKMVAITSEARFIFNGALKRTPGVMDSE